MLDNSWLMKSAPYLQYLVLTELEGKPEDDPDVIKAHQLIFKDSRMVSLISEVNQWPGEVLKRHNDASHILHKLAFLADMGVKATDIPIKPAIDKILHSQSTEGAFRVLANVSSTYGGDGTDTLAWMLCDSPAITYALAKMGLASDDRVKKSAGHLVSLAAGNGWPCKVSEELRKFRGPGRKSDPCPYATLITLKALAQFPEWRENEVCRQGTEALLTLWEQRREHKAYLFGMGTDFSKLKAPLIWYDILHMLYVLTQFPWLHDDIRLFEMLDVLRAKIGAEGRLSAESIWKAWADWDFGQKKQPSPSITLLAQSILKRAGTV